VANRLAVIHESSDISQWNYIETKQRPADLASRGASIERGATLDFPNTNEQCIFPSLSISLR
jgi:beta-xylosidase